MNDATGNHNQKEVSLPPASGAHRTQQMTRNDINKYLCGILSTLAVVDYAPEASIYLAMGMNLGNWETIKAILIRGGLATSENFAMRITPAGRAMAAKIDAMAVA